MLTVTDAADDLQLLSTVELRLAAGLDGGDASHDDELATIGLRASAALAAACGVAAAGYDASYLAESPPLRGEAPRTLKAEAVSETLRSPRQFSPLFLARRPILAVSSLSVGGSAVAATD